MAPIARPPYFVNYGKYIPYKWIDFGSECENSQGEDCVGTVRLCGTCIHKSDLGNLMLGAVGHQWLRGFRLVIGGARVGGGTGRIDSPEDLAAVMLGLLMDDIGMPLLYTDLSSVSEHQMCKLLQANYRSEIETIVLPAFNGAIESLGKQLNRRNLLSTIGGQYEKCSDCDPGVYYHGGHSSFPPHTDTDLAKGWQARQMHRLIYKSLPIHWPGDTASDPCSCPD